MKKLILSISLFLSIATMISADNVFFQPFKTTNGAVPFDRITTADYEPAIIEGMKCRNRCYSQPRSNSNL